MTLAMPDSIHPADLPAGYPAYLGYVDGLYQTAGELRNLHPAAYILGLTVTGETLAADGIDCEIDNPDAAASADWTARKLASSPKFRPVIYASVIGNPGYGMGDVLRELAARGIPRPAVRLLTAHYATQHICGPSSCGLLPADADGTQWTDKWAGNNGALIDMSVLRDDFFTSADLPKEKDIMRLPPAPGEWGPTVTQFIDHAGVLYVVGPNGGNAIYWTKSTDGGAHWSTPALMP